MDSMTSTNICWSILKTLLNHKKTACITPLFHQCKYVTDLKKKAELFECFFAKQCFLIERNFSFTLCKKTDKSASTVSFKKDFIVRVIQKLDPKKAHGHGMVSLRILKLRSKSICKLRDVPFQT